MSPNADLDSTVQICRGLADPTRLRLLAVLAEEPLSVAELTEATRLPQPRVSTHLRKLRELNLVENTRVDGNTRYHLPADGWPAAHRDWISSVLSGAADPLLAEDARRARKVVALRHSDVPVDAVSGRVSRHYSPGRTWESLARTIAGLVSVGRVVDIGSGDGAVAEMLAAHATEVVCVDNDPRVVSLGHDLLSHCGNVQFIEADMHEMPLGDDSFDVALLLGTLHFSNSPEQVLREAARMLRPGGRLVVNVLRRHVHVAESRAFGHVNTGFEPAELIAMLRSAGFSPRTCGVVSREKRAPHFEVVAATAIL